MIFLWISLLLLSSHCADAFFFSQLFRRQVPSEPSSSRAQVAGVEENPAFRLIHPTRQTPPDSTSPNINFQVPLALCRACGNFPWTPVAGKEGPSNALVSQQQSPNEQMSSSGQVEQVSKVVDKIPPSQLFVPKYEENEGFGIHQHLEVSKEPGNTVVINALGPHPELQRQPFSFAYLAPTGNLKPQVQEFGKPILLPYERQKIMNEFHEQQRVPAGSSLSPGYAQPPQTKPTPPSASSQPLFLNSRSPPPGLYGSNSPSPFNIPQPSVLRPITTQPQSFTSTHLSNIPPITVGTILAAQQHYHLQPAQLVYQEHTHNQPPVYAPLLQRQPHNYPTISYGQPHHFIPQQAPQSFKLPILPSQSQSASGTVTVNQIPLHAIPNYQPSTHHYLSSFLPPTNLQYPQIINTEEHGLNLQTQQTLQPKQPKPGYTSLTPVTEQGYEPSFHNQYRVPQQQVRPTPQFDKQTNHEELKKDALEPQAAQLQPHNAPQPETTSQSKMTELGHAQLPPPPRKKESEDGMLIGVHGNSLPQKPLPPNQPYSPPQPSPTYRPIEFPQREIQAATPTPTYIPPRVAGQLFGSYPSDLFEGVESEKFPIQSDLVGYNDLELSGDINLRGNEGGVSFPRPQATLELGPIENNHQRNQFSTTSTTIPTNWQNSKNQQTNTFSYSNGSEGQRFNNQPEVRIQYAPPTNEERDQYSQRPITIPHLLQIQSHPELRYIDQSEPFRHQFIVPVGQKGIVSHENTAQMSIFSTHLREPMKEDMEPTPSSSLQSTTSTPTNGLMRVEESSTSFGGSRGESVESEREREKVSSKDRNQFPPTPYGSYEIVPATQYDITHLFADSQKQDTKRTESNREFVSNGFPVPVPVPVSEDQVGNSKSPLFVVGSPVAPGDELGTNDKSGFFRQTQYDSLPPSIVSALHHAQRTSFLTHSQYTPLNVKGNKDERVKANSIYTAPQHSMSETPLYRPQTKMLQPIAFDLNSGREIQIQRNQEAEIQSLKAVVEADYREERRKLIPVYRLHEESQLRFGAMGTDLEEKQTLASPSDQTLVNCQKSQQWIYPPARNREEQDGNGETQLQGEFQTLPQRQSDGKGDEGSRLQNSAQILNKFVVESNAETLGENERKPYVFYYPPPAPFSTGVVYLEEPPQSTQKQLVDRPEIETENPVPEEIPLEKIESREKTYLAKPILKWSKVIEPLGKKQRPLVTTFSGTTNKNEEQVSTTLFPILFGKDHIVQVEQSLDNSDKPESEPMESGLSSVFSGDGPKDFSYPIAVETGNGGRFKIVGPTTTAECLTETTTEPSTLESEGIETTTTGQPFPTTQRTTFSPRIQPKREEDKLMIRPGGGYSTRRPTPSSFRQSGDGKAVSASAQVPVYRPQQGTKHQVSLEDMYRSKEMGGLSARTSSTESPSTRNKESPVALLTNEDDEADDEADDALQLPTPRKVASQSLTPKDIHFSSQISPTKSPVDTTSTKVIKTIRVRQRMRPGTFINYTNGSTLLRSRVSGSSRVRVMEHQRQQTSSESVKNKVETVAPEESLPEEEQKEVKKALIEIRKI